MNKKYCMRSTPLFNPSVSERIFAYDKEKDLWVYDYLSKLSHTEIPQTFILGEVDEHGRMIIIASSPEANLASTIAISDRDINKWMSKGCPEYVDIIMEEIIIHQKPQYVGDFPKPIHSGKFQPKLTGGMLTFSWDNLNDLCSGEPSNATEHARERVASYPERVELAKTMFDIEIAVERWMKENKLDDLLIGGKNGELYYLTEALEDFASHMLAPCSVPDEEHVAISEIKRHIDTLMEKDYLLATPKQKIALYILQMYKAGGLATERKYAPAVDLIAECNEYLNASKSEFIIDNISTRSIFHNRMKQVLDSIKADAVPAKKVTFHFTNEGESDFPAIGAFRVDSMKEGNPLIRFNLEAFFWSYRDKTLSEMTELIKDVMLEIYTHEFAHSMQEFLGLEFSEEQVDKILAKYNEEWQSRDMSPDTETPMIDAQSVLQYMEDLNKIDNIEQVKKELENILPMIRSMAYTGQVPEVIGEHITEPEDIIGEEGNK